MSKKLKLRLDSPRQEVEEAILRECDELSFEDLEYVIDLPNDVTHWMYETMECFGNDELHDLYMRIKQYKADRDRDLNEARLKAAHQITMLAFKYHIGQTIPTRTDVEIREQASKLANKLIK